MPAAKSPEPAAARPEKKHKKDKSSKAERKREREEDASVDAEERKHKKSKAAAGEAVGFDAEPSEGLTKKEKKKKKEKRSKQGEEAAEAVDNDELKAAKKSKKKSTLDGSVATPIKTDDDDDHVTDKHKKRKKKSAKHGKVEGEDEAVPATQGDADADADADAMDIDQPTSSTSSSHVHQPPDMPANPQFPFFSQTVSLYEPLYPQGWAQPVTHCQYQHLQHLQNKYVPSLRGVLLSYKNVAIGPNPGRDGAATDDDMPTTVRSLNEFAVGFGWITADVELFVPSRGAWMEGSINLQTEGHVGVVCYGKFNASVEARRLPPSWRWVSNESADARGFEETASVMTSDDHGVARQIHSTGFWTDGAGDKVKGKIRFRIRNFDAGTSGETSYLSLEGTMLDEASEKKLIKEEARTAQMRREKKSGWRIERRRAPEFSMTRFAPEGAETEGEAVKETEETKADPSVQKSSEME
ncbi:DNA-dependent RNA polymerase I subunit A43 [Drechmeria coniospora]|uniref:DNA-dependent RNA polymerase I subunit A43 n=1 Tax=Drechmeria coniospora TaxID=98403 RepID=A0A151GAC9_DRECN|nr:DNA-dependent RNA polymerase I subunit A43 [Drechmeria coniospora]KYK54044.1 DNA-dependent RNA polymerase I subunit A43 [Drechmeria coniospora]